MKQTNALSGAVGDAPLGHAVEAHVEVVEALPLRLRHVAALHGAVGLRQLALLLDGDAGKPV